MLGERGVGKDYLVNQVYEYLESRELLKNKYFYWSGESVDEFFDRIEKLHFFLGYERFVIFDNIGKVILE